MSKKQPRQVREWTNDEVAREAAANRGRAARDRQAGPADNVKAAAALARFANRVADAAEAARRDGSSRS
jgi:hypothetical protein